MYNRINRSRYLHVYSRSIALLWAINWVNIQLTHIIELWSVIKQSPNVHSKCLVTWEINDHMGIYILAIESSYEINVNHKYKVRVPLALHRPSDRALAFWSMLSCSLDFPRLKRSVYVLLGRLCSSPAWFWLKVEVLPRSNEILSRPPKLTNSWWRRWLIYFKQAWSEEWP